MTMSAAIQRYKAVQVKTSSPGEILVMLYDGLFKFLEEAKEALAADDRARAGERINRAHAIISELATSLNKSVAPELCENLEAIYFFCSGRLIEANLHRDPDRIAEVIRVLAPVRDGFKLAVANAAGGAA